MEELSFFISSDGLGSRGFGYLPHKPLWGSEKPGYNDMLELQVELTMVHNFFTIASIHLPQLETCGSNACLNALYGALYAVAKRSGVKRIDTVYVGLDNTVKSNKNWIMMRGLSALVALGIVRKVKPIFRLVGHTKNQVLTYSL